METVKLKIAFEKFKKKFKKLNLDSENKKLQKAYKELEKAYRQESEQRAEYEQLIIDKTRFVAMGEMMDAVAHQWTQPLSLISIYLYNMKTNIQDSNIQNEELENDIKAIQRQAEFMESTLREFRNFLSPINFETTFELNKTIKKALSLVEDEFYHHDIEIEYNKSNNIYVHGNSKEVKHVLINILNNAKEAFKCNKIQNPKIKIYIKDDIAQQYLFIEDNGGGIDIHLLDKIFKPYVSTKKELESSGIGLYMCQLIMQKHNGKIEAQNFGDGARFILTF